MILDIGRTTGGLPLQTNVNDYVYEVLVKFTRDITDRVFVMIESDKQLRRRYDKITGSKSARNALNARLGRRIREYFDLRNTGRSHHPVSGLINSYEQHARN